MIGTSINAGAIVFGSTLGVFMGSRFSERIRETVLNGLGLLIVLIGLQMALGTKNILIVLAAILLGGLAGEILHLHDGIETLRKILQNALSKGKQSTFGEGFVTASLIFCVGPMAVLGSIQDGLTGDYSILAVKAALDGFAAIAFSATLGWGVACSAISIAVYQGFITLFANLLSQALTDQMVVEMTATGGLIIVGMGLKLLNVKDMRLASFLPALALAPVIVALLRFWQ